MPCECFYGLLRVIRGHHLYKSSWSPKFREEPTCKKDVRKEANEYYDHDDGVIQQLVGYVPIEFSSLQSTFFLMLTVGIIFMLLRQEKEEGGWLCGSSISQSTDERQEADKSP